MTRLIKFSIYIILKFFYYIWGLKQTIMMKKILFALVALVVCTGVNGQRRNNFGGSWQAQGGQTGRAARTGQVRETRAERNAYRSEQADYVSDYSYGDAGAAALEPRRLGLTIHDNGLNRLWMTGHLQADAAGFFMLGKNTPKIGNGAILRRARVGLGLDLGARWTSLIEAEIDNGVAMLKNAVVTYKNGDFRVRGGNFKEDFTMASTASVTDLWTMELPMAVSTFAPGYHLGIDARYQHNWIYASLGVFGQAIGSAAMADRVSEANLTGRGQGYSGTARVVFTPFWQRSDWGVHVGGAASYSTPMTSAETASLGGFRYSTTSSNAINRVRYLDTDKHPDVTEYELLMGGELAGFWRGARLQGEYVVAKNTLKKERPEGYLSSYQFNGWYAQVSYLLFGGQQRYSAALGCFTAPALGREWGDIELVARYDYLNLIDRNIVGGDGQNMTFGVNYHINNNLRVMLNYQFSDNSGTKTYPKGTSFHMAGLRLEMAF